ncbi:MAG: hypothetical protein A3K18_01175 [Lentisphaerae bacterium RIFOXYA12_64_32]|nr:MAG: hypothetical protein A3K18_01175 [Lentisphaerae bacterium RIFOXYA12_64_32]
MVAAEVKNLSLQTARATGEIGTQITEIQAATCRAVEAITGIGKTITDVSEVAAAIAAAMKEQNASTGEIVRNVRTLATDADSVQNSVLDMGASIASYGSAIQVLWAARDLGKPSRVLETEVDAFLNRVRQT